MKIKLLHFLLLPLLSILIFSSKIKRIMELCHLDACLYCYGDDMCQDVEKNLITLTYDSVTDIIYNLVSVKNVFFAKYKDKKVVLKKLEDESDMEQDKSVIGSLNLEVLRSMSVGTNNYLSPFCVCDNETFEVLLGNIKYKTFEHVYTLLRINAEPVLLQIFNSRENYPVPHYYGACGRLVIEENCGRPLNDIEKFSWFDRAFVAYQLLQAAYNFTENHGQFRLYLTDISPDNIVVNEDLKVRFIDLENGVLRSRAAGSFSFMNKHRTEHLENTYYYSPSSLCGHHISDHNIYGVCMLLLSKSSPWPMMEGGLLHTPPMSIINEHNVLFKNIELCVDSENELDRFELSDNIMSELKVMLSKHNINL
ncbi:arrestin 1 isoform X2 [Leptinotarsa decemlineata]|uniref:arrestin 1 isoform X2 n=1 Tax=Leptinotarsa decemlineata TaxID=7539 RepID=UPI003D308541